MSWFVRLVTPPGGKVFEPFAGTGTTIEAALNEGMTVIGVEMEPLHVSLIQKRLEKYDGLVGYTSA